MQSGISDNQINAAEFESSTDLGTTIDNGFRGTQGVSSFTLSTKSDILAFIELSYYGFYSYRVSRYISVLGRTFLFKRS
jgi:hypothetical protein